MGRRARVRIAACVAALGLSALSATLLVACGGTAGSSPAPSSPAPAVYTEADSGATVETSVGERFTVSLEENPTTGYSWDMIAGPGLTQVGDKYVAPNRSPSPPMGAGGTHSWVFRADEAGTLTLTGRYVRPWEEDGKSAADFSLTIEVR